MPNIVRPSLSAGIKAIVFPIPLLQNFVNREFIHVIENDRIIDMSGQDKC